MNLVMLVLLTYPISHSFQEVVLGLNSILMLSSVLPVISVPEAQEMKGELCVFLPKSGS